MKLPNDLMTLCKIQAPRMCNMNDVVSARNACGSLCLRNRSFLHLFCGRAHMLALDRMLGAHSNVFQPAACFLSEPVQRGGDSAKSGGEVACRARLLGNPTREGRAVSGPNLCPGARRLLAGGRPSHPLIAAILLIAVRRRATRPTVNQDSF